MARAALIVAGFGIISRFLGFVRELVLSGVYGTSARTDAYVASLFIVNTFAAVVLYVLVTTVIPVFQEEEIRHGERSAWSLLAAVLAWVGIGLIVVTGLVMIWPDLVVAMFRPSPAAAAYADRLLLIMAPALALQGFTALFTALLQVRFRFTRPAAIGVVFNAGIILGVAVLNPFIGIRGAAWGVLIGAIGQVVLQLPEFLTFWRAGGARMALAHPRLGATGLLALPVLVASVAQQINGFTDKLFAYTLPAGRVSALTFASAIGTAPRTAILFPLLVPLFPHIARLLSERRADDARRAFHRAAGLLAMMAVPTSVYMATEAQGLTQLAFQRGRCNVACRIEIGKPVLYYGLAVWGAFLVYLLNRVLSAARRPNEILVSTVATVALVIGLDIILLGPMQQSGLALASMIGVYANALMMLFQLRKHLEGLSVREVLVQQGRIGACMIPAAAALVVWGGMMPSDGHRFAVTLGLVVVKGIVAFALFLAVAARLAPEELRATRQIATSTFRRRRRPAGQPGATA